MGQQATTGTTGNDRNPARRRVPSGLGPPVHAGPSKALEWPRVAPTARSPHERRQRTAVLSLPVVPVVACPSRAVQRSSPSHRCRPLRCSPPPSCRCLSFLSLPALPELFSGLRYRTDVAHCAPASVRRSDRTGDVARFGTEAGADVAELVDARDLGSRLARGPGSSPGVGMTDDADGTGAGASNGRAGRLPGADGGGTIPPVGGAAGSEPRARLPVRRVARRGPGVSAQVTLSLRP